MNPASKSGASYAEGEVIIVEPRLKGYSRKWNMVKNLPGGMCLRAVSIYLDGSHVFDLHVVTKPTGNDTVVHDWLVWLVLEVRVPAAAELWARPRVHLLELFLGGADLHTGFDTIGGKRARAVDVPLVENLLLNLLVAADEVVEALDVRLSAVCGKGEVVILEAGVMPLAREIQVRSVVKATYLSPTPGRSIKGLTPALRSFSGSPIPERCRINGELKVPPLTMICFLALYTLDWFWLGESGLVGTVLTPTARSPSMMTFSILVLQTRCKFWW